MRPTIHVKVRMRLSGRKGVPLRFGIIEVRAGRAGGGRVLCDERFDLVQPGATAATVKRLVDEARTQYRYVWMDSASASWYGSLPTTDSTNVLTAATVPPLETAGGRGAAPPQLVVME